MEELNIYLVIIIPVLVIILLKLVLPSKGALGEKRVAVILSKLPTDRYKVINNLLVNHNGITSQIDHIVVSVYGIFVIETKTYKGWISGSESSDYWTQNIYGKKYQLRNPIHQNYGHIKALMQLLQEYPSLKYISIVVFSREARLRVSSNIPVIHWNKLRPVISQFENRILTEEQVQMVYDSLLSSNIDSRENRKQHVRNVKATIRNRKEVISSGRCPRCNGELVKRQGKYGSFYGCSNYPKCKYTLTKR